MNTQVSAKYSHKPLLFVILPLLLFILFRNVGVLLIVGFLTPIFQYIGKVFTRYKIKENTLVIKTLFNKKEISFKDIHSMQTLQSNEIQQWVWALPREIQIIQI